MTHTDSPGMYVFDHENNEKENVQTWSKTPLTIILISQWENLAGTTRRWHGLLLQKIKGTSEDGGEVYRRVGVYMGSSQLNVQPERYANSLVESGNPGAGWERRDFYII